MWELKIAEGDGPYLYSTNNFVGRQFWEFNPDAGTPEEKEEIEKVRQKFKDDRRKGGFHACGDLLMRMQLMNENEIDLTSILPMRLSKDEKVSFEAVTITVKKAVRLHRAIQAKDGHWPAENAGPLFFTPPLLIALYVSGTINTVLNEEHKKEMKRYFYNHQVVVIDILCDFSIKFTTTSTISNVTRNPPSPNFCRPCRDVEVDGEGHSASNPMGNLTRSAKDWKTDLESGKLVRWWFRRCFRRWSGDAGGGKVVLLVVR